MPSNPPLPPGARTSRPHNTLSPRRQPDPGPNLDPLLNFYREAHRTAPSVRILSPEALPQPYRDLLAHDTDMTSTLETFHVSPIRLEVLSRRLEGPLLAREVLLVRESDGRPVEYGAIEIQLDPFPEPWRSEVLAGRRPLGGILNASQLPYTSRPTAFFSLPADPFLTRVLQLPPPTAAPPTPLLYGRRNTLRTTDGRVLAEIIEILPPQTGRIAAAAPTA